MVTVMPIDREPALDRLHQGDCVAGMKQLGDASVDLVFADPPFNIGYDYDIYDDRRDAEAYQEWSVAWGREVVRLLKPTGTFWLAIGDEFAAELKLLFHRELGLSLRSWVIWYYTFGVHCTKKFARSHAHLFYFVKDPKCYTFNDQAIRVPSARQLVYADARANPQGRLPDDTWILRPQDLPEGFAADGDTWYFSRVCGTFKERAGWHGCQMPERLLSRIIEGCSQPGDTVLDPFAGSGTTLVVAKKLRRRFLGFELSPEYCAQIERRLQSTRAAQRLEGMSPNQSGKPTPAKVPAPRARGQSAHNRPEAHQGVFAAFAGDEKQVVRPPRERPRRAQ
jgi:site-specific DNA-methyltransferase (adenine-specific)